MFDWCHEKGDRPGRRWGVLSLLHPNPFERKIAQGNRPENWKCAPPPLAHLHFPAFQLGSLPGWLPTPGQLLNFLQDYRCKTWTQWKRASKKLRTAQETPRSLRFKKMGGASTWKRSTKQRGNMVTISPIKRRRICSWMRLASFSFIHVDCNLITSYNCSYSNFRRALENGKTFSGYGRIWCNTFRVRLGLNGTRGHGSRGRFGASSCPAAAFRRRWTGAVCLSWRRPPGGRSRHFFLFLCLVCFVLVTA